MNYYLPNTYADKDNGAEVIARKVDNDTFVVTKTVGNETYQKEWTESEFFSNYRLILTRLTTYDFSDALKALKEGKRIQRINWNSNNQWVVMIDPGNAMHVSTAGAFDMQKCFGLKNAQGKMQPGWIPSIGDLLAVDWVVITDQWSIVKD